MSALWDWWLLPLSGAATHTVNPYVYWHARLMVLAWGVLLPLGVLLARYFKVLPSQNWPSRLDNKLWWHAHRSLQWLGLLLATLGLFVVWPYTPAASSLARGHAWLGWGLMWLGWLQLLSGLVRGSKGGPGEPSVAGDHYAMTAHRVWFERLHKSLGWLLIFSAISVILVGLLLVDAPRWMPALLLAWWAGLAALALRWQSQGRCVDTYQAIWGPDLKHPGNHLRPIGWGVHRPLKTFEHGQR